MLILIALLSKLAIDEEPIQLKHKINDIIDIISEITPIYFL